MNRFCGNCFNESVNDQGICNLCGFNDRANWDKAPHGLPAGTILNGRYIIGRVLGQGGFGITYTARDHQTGQLVAVKEFFPDSMATRSERTSVIPFSGDRGEGFVYGKECFLREAQTMAEFIGNANIVRVYSYFEENETAYFVMEYVDGQSLQEYLKSKGGAISLEEALEILYPVMDALSAVHEKGIIHRDIAPDNIYISKSGEVKLLDFGAARYSLGNVSRSLDVILKHGFAPREQYKRRGRQGPYTDVYSMAATLYYAITGNRPDDALERQDEDDMPLPSSLGAKISPQQEDVLLKAMAVEPADRYQSMAEFRHAVLMDIDTVEHKRLEQEQLYYEQQERGHLQGVQNKEGDKKTILSKELSSVHREQNYNKKAHQNSRYLKGLLASVAALLISIALIGISKSNSIKNDTAIDLGGQNPVTQTEQKHSISKDMSGKTEPMTTPSEKTTPKIIIELNKDGMPLNALKENRLTEADRSSTFGTKVPRQQVATITFLDSIKDAPASSVDASQLGNGRVKAWAVEQNSNPSDSLSGTLYDLYIAADGGVCAPVDSWCLFELMTNLKSISFGNAFYTDYTTNMDAMFQNCHSLTELDLSNFNTENVEKMLFMFNECNALKKLDLSSFDTSKVTDTACMFQNCNALIDLDLRNFDTSNVNNMQYMFFGCYNLTSLAVSSFNTSKVTKMDCMFLDCRSLASLDVSSFNTSKVTNMDGMFYGCNKLTDFHCYDNRIMKAYLNR